MNASSFIILHSRTVVVLLFHPSILAVVEESAAIRGVKKGNFIAKFIQAYTTRAEMQTSALYGGYVLQIGLKRREQALDEVGGDIHVEHLAGVVHPFEF